MAWYLSTTRIFTQDWKQHENQIIPRLQPLNGGTVLQFFGYESPITAVTVLIVGNTDKEALRSMTESGISYTLTSPEGSLGSYFVHSIAFARVSCICQTIRPDLDAISPVYTAEIELYPDE